MAPASVVSKIAAAKLEVFPIIKQVVELKHEIPSVALTLEGSGNALQELPPFAEERIEADWVLLTKVAKHKLEDAQVTSFTS